MKLHRWCAWVFLLIAAAWYTYDTGVDQLPSSGGSDFGIYRLAAVHILHGESPYAEPGYIYPPLLAYLLTPLAGMPYLPARWVWFVTGHAALLLAGYLIWRKLGGGIGPACVVALVWAGGRAAGECLAMGQVTPELTLLLAIAYATGSLASPLAIGCGVGIKIIPGVVEIALVLGRAWKSAIVCLAVAAALMVAPWLATAAFLRGPASVPNADFLAGSPAVLNWSLPADTLRIMDPQPLHGPVPASWTNTFALQFVHGTPAQHAAGLAVAALVFGGGLIWLAVSVRGRLSTVQLPLAMAALVTLVLVASPISWAQYQTMQYPGMALLLGRFAANRRWLRFASAAALAVFLYPFPVEVLRVLYHRHETWPDSAVTMYFWTSTAAVAGLAIYWLMVSELRADTRAVTCPTASSQSS